MSSFRNLNPRRAHKERAQPSRRVARHGLLEKKKDYKLRARDASRKARRAALLREKASFRNPDEFYHAMLSAGPRADPRALNHHVADGDVRRLVETQDRAYVRWRAARERCRVRGARDALHFAGGGERRRHVVFVGDDEGEGVEGEGVEGEGVEGEGGETGEGAGEGVHGGGLEEFDRKKHFEAEGARLRRAREGDRAFVDAAEEVEAGPARVSSRERRRARKAAAASYNELAQREARVARLDTAMEDLVLRQNLLGKGARRRVSPGDAQAGILPVFKWRKQRSK